MALFKILRGNSSKLFDANGNISSTVPFNDGYCYFTPDNKKFYIDWLDESNVEHRDPLNSLLADTLLSVYTDSNGNTVYTSAKVVGGTSSIIDSNEEIPTSAVLYAKFDEIKKIIDENIPFKPAGKSYLTFSSPNSFTLAVGDATKYWDGTLEYFDSNKTWITWNGATTLSSINNDGEYVLYLRGIGNTKLSYYDESTSTYIPLVINGTDVRCDGNIENLLDYATVESGQHPTMADGCFASLFMGCTALTKAPDLPATTLAIQCYASMFAGCTSLIQAPALPSTTLEPACYGYMFYGCTSLTQAPTLPATTLAAHCYAYMFFGCTSLTQTPALPATTLEDECYNSMFQGCTSLTQTPALPATTLTNWCYNSMFRGCTSLTQVSALPATTLKDYCYYGMFQGCTSLTKAPALPATTLALNCYAHMFNGCTNLIQAPALPATTLEDYCYYNMFNDCTSLTKAPTLPATTLATYCYQYMFQNCTSLIQVPALPATTLETYCYANMFMNCTSLKLSSTQTEEYTQEYRIPFSGTGTIAYNAFTNMFANTGGTFTGTPEINTTYYLSSDNMIVYDTEVDTLREYIEVISANQCKPISKSYLTFSSPNSFTLAVGDAPEESPQSLAISVEDTTEHWDGILEYSTDKTTWIIWDGTVTLSAVNNDGEYVLYLRGTGNTKISGRHASWVIDGTDVQCDGNIETLLDYTTVESGIHPIMAEGCFSGLFNNCIALITPPKLPATILVTGCYAGMFQGCTSLTQAPTLPATMLADYCYIDMFNGCTSLIQAPALPATTLADHCYCEMFLGCASLTQAPTLPATMLADYCYTDMFNGCTSLIQAPVLPATTLASDCYSGMFAYCTSLVLAPALPVTILVDYCYANMFYRCTSLIHAPALPATTLATSCYLSMFEGCIGLTQAPSLPATTLGYACYSTMFQNCTNLIQAPTLPATTLEVACYYQMFSGCTNLILAPNLPATTLADSCYQAMFRNCTSLILVPALPATTLAKGCYASMFNGCTKIKLSSAQTGEYTIAYRIPSSGTGTTAHNALNYMFASTGGTFTGAPSINTTYYLSSDNMIVYDTGVDTLREYIGSIAAPASHVSDSTIHVTAEEKAVWNAKANIPRMVPISLSASGWDSSTLTQTVMVYGVVADETAQLIITSPARACQSVYYEAGIMCTEQNDNSLTFTASAIPTRDLTVYVVIQEIYINMEEILVDFYYTENDDGTYTITDWKGTLNGVPSTTMVVPNNSKIIF